MRLFVALNLPADARDRLAQLLQALRELDLPVRWLDTDSLHITLKFLGEVADPRGTEVQAAVQRSAARSSGFTVTLSGFGAFPSLRKPHLFWLGVEDSVELQRLHENVAQELATIGFEREQRAFAPHITLGRVHKDAWLRASHVQQAKDVFGYEANIVVETVDLMRSYTDSRGARYELLLAASLTKKRV